MDFKKYLENSEIIDFSDPGIQNLAKELSRDCKDDKTIAKNCFLYVRDKIQHSGDHKADVTTLKAGDVLKYKTGWCYAKAHLLAALLRANNIPAGFCYQQLSCGEYKDNTYCLHGLNAVYLKKYGWYRVDARGNKDGVEARFNPPVEKLAFELEDREFDLAGIFDKPIEAVVKALQTYKNYDEISGHFPVLQGFISRCTLKDALILSKISDRLLKYLFEDDLPEWSKESFSTANFEKRLSDTSYRHYCYVIQNQIAGYIAIKDKTHLYHLFVDEKYHRKGIAKKLWEFVRDNLEFDVMTTNSSICAIEVYKSFGFNLKDEMLVHKELKYQPMIYKKGNNAL